MSMLLIGLGNPILSDDAVGVRLAGDFAQRLAGRPGLKCLPNAASVGWRWSSAWLATTA
jgi:Ni,Fe-hydrogenase maturation factor